MKRFFESLFFSSILFLLQATAYPQTQNSQVHLSERLQLLPSFLASGSMSRDDLTAHLNGLKENKNLLTDQKSLSALDALTNLSNKAKNLEECLDRYQKQDPKFYKKDHIISQFLAGYADDIVDCFQTSDPLAGIQDLERDINVVAFRLKQPPEMSKDELQKLSEELYERQKKKLFYTNFTMLGDLGKEFKPRDIDWLKENFFGKDSKHDARKDQSFLQIASEFAENYEATLKRLGETDSESHRKKQRKKHFAQTRQQFKDYRASRLTLNEQNYKLRNRIRFLEVLPELPNFDFPKPPISTIIGKPIHARKPVFRIVPKDIDQGKVLYDYLAKGKEPDGWTLLASEKPKTLGEMAARLSAAKSSLNSAFQDETPGENSDRLDLIGFTVDDLFEQAIVSQMKVNKTRRDLLSNPVALGSLGSRYTVKKNQTNSIGESFGNLFGIYTASEGDAIVDNDEQKLIALPRQTDQDFDRYLGVYQESVQKLVEEMEKWKEKEKHINTLDPKGKKHHEDFIKNMLYANPELAGEYLADNPHMAPYLCDIAVKAHQEKDKDKENSLFWKKVATWGTIAAGALLLAATLATGGLALLGMGAIGSYSLATIGVGLTAGSFALGAVSGTIALREGFNFSEEADLLEARLVAYGVGDPKEIADLVKQARQSYWTAAADLLLAPIDGVQFFKSFKQIRSMKKLKEMANASPDDIAKILSKEKALQTNTGEKTKRNPQVVQSSQGPLNGPSGSTYKAKPMMEVTDGGTPVRQYDAENVHYLKENQKDMWKAYVDKEGRFTRASGKPFQCDNCIYVMDTNGELYVFKDGGKFNGMAHSSFLSGDPVAGAGHMTIDENGFLKMINNNSGHYKPEKIYLDQVESELKKRGANLDSTDIVVTFDESVTSARNYEHPDDVLVLSQKVRLSNNVDLSAFAPETRQLFREDGVLDFQNHQALLFYEEGIPRGNFTDAAQSYGIKVAGQKPIIKALTSRENYLKNKADTLLQKFKEPNLSPSEKLNIQEELKDIATEQQFYSEALEYSSPERAFKSGKIGIIEFWDNKVGIPLTKVPEVQVKQADTLTILRSDDANSSFEGFSLSLRRESNTPFIKFTEAQKNSFQDIHKKYQQAGLNSQDDVLKLKNDLSSAGFRQDQVDFAVHGGYFGELPKKTPPLDLITGSTPKLKSQLEELDEIKYTEKNPKDMDPKEREDFKIVEKVKTNKAGTIAKAKDSLSHLPDGDYLFVIDQSGNLAYSNRYINPPEVELVKHPALVNSLKEINPDPKVIAAGEFQIKDGKVYFINNKSGHYMGGAESFQFAINRLEASGLPKSPNRIEMDLSKLDPEVRKEMSNHTLEGRATLLFREVAQAPATVQNQIEESALAYNSVLNRLSKMYPNVEKPVEQIYKFFDDAFEADEDLSFAAMTFFNTLGSEGMNPQIMAAKSYADLLDTRIDIQNGAIRQSEIDHKLNVDRSRAENQVESINESIDPLTTLVGKVEATKLNKTLEDAGITSKIIETDKGFVLEVDPKTIPSLNDFLKSQGHDSHQFKVFYDPQYYSENRDVLGSLKPNGDIYLNYSVLDKLARGETPMTPFHELRHLSRSLNRNLGKTDDMDVHYESLLKKETRNPYENIVDGEELATFTQDISRFPFEINDSRSIQAMAFRIETIGNTIKDFSSDSISHLRKLNSEIKETTDIGKFLDKNLKFNLKQKDPPHLLSFETNNSKINIFLSQKEFQKLKSLEDIEFLGNQKEGIKELRSFISSILNKQISLNTKSVQASQRAQDITYVASQYSDKPNPEQASNLRKIIKELQELIGGH
ncbi:MAG: hypothetical protein ACPGJV_10505 [Bacteriovoracaceae bacterium]